MKSIVKVLSIVGIAVWSFACETPKQACVAKCSKDFENCTAFSGAIATSFSSSSSSSSSSSGSTAEDTEEEGTSPNTNEFLYYSHNVSIRPSISSSGVSYAKINANLSSTSDTDNIYFNFSTTSEPGNYPFSIESGSAECRVYQANSNNPYTSRHPDYTTDSTLKDPANDTTFFTFLGTINSSNNYTYSLTSTPTSRILIYFHCYLASGGSTGNYSIFLGAEANSSTTTVNSGTTFALSSLNSCRTQRSACKKKCNSDNPL